MSTKEVFLDGNPPWGFRMNGGADAGHPLRISRVNPGSKAEAKGVREGDLITSINGQSTKCLTNSESHALLRTVKENLLLGLNEDKNASPRRRSREIKTASIISQEKEPSDSPGHPKGVRKVSSQKKHPKRGRFKHRIKEFLGFKTKEKRNPEDEPWVIVDSSLKSHETYSVSELGTDEENNSRTTRAASEPIKNFPDETYENFSFQSDQRPLRTVETKPQKSFEETKPQKSFEESKPQKSFEVTKVEETVHFLDIKECDRSNVLQADVSNRNLGVSGDIGKDIEVFEFDQPCLSSPKSSEKRFKFKNLPNETNEYRLDNEPLWVPQEPKVLEKSATEVHFSENDVLTETLKELPSNDMVEVCNATIMIEDKNLASEELHLPLITVKDMHGKDDARSPNPDYEPIEVNSSAIVYPPYNSTLNYFFPRRLEVISEESSDLSENNEEKKERKPWENSELIRRANDVPCIPNDWFGSDDGIDTSWRDGRSIEEVSDIAIVSDSHSDSDLVSEELKVNKAVVTENETIKYIVSKSNPKRNQICNLEKIEGKPPAKTSVSERKNLPKTEGLRSHLENGNGPTKNQATLISTLENMNKESLTKGQPQGSDEGRSKVTCRVIESPTSCRKNNSKSTQPSPSCERKFVKEKSKSPEIKRQVSALKQSPDVQGATKVSCTIIKQEEIQFQSGKGNVVDYSPRVSKKNIDPPDTSKCDGARNLTTGLKDDKSALKNTNTDKNEDIKLNKPKSKVPISESSKTTLAPFQICQRSNQENVLSESNKSCQKVEFAKREADKKRGVQLSTNTINPLTISEIELVYIDSSDSDAISNRTSVSLEKEEEALLEDKKNEVVQLKDKNKPMKFEEDRNQIIKKEITNINQSVKEISSICNESSTSFVKFHKKPPNIDVFQFAPSEYPNLLSPIFSRKNSSKKIDKKRRFSYPIAEQDLVKAFSDSCLKCTSLKAAESLCKHHDSNNNQRDSKSGKTSTNILTNPFKEPELNRKIYTLRSLPSTPPANSEWITLSSNQNESLDSILLEFSDESVSSESYTLPQDKSSEKLSDESSDTIKYFRIPGHSPKSAQSPPEVSDIVDLHKKFFERRGYHEVSPLMKKKTEVKQKIPEPDLIALSKCSKERNEQAYTPELLAEAANLLALHRYHESRQRKMCQENNINKDVKNKSPPPSVQPEKIKITPQNNIKTVKDDVIKECMTASSSEKGMNEPIAEYKCIYKSDCPENETVGKSRLLELFQKLGSKSSSTDSSLPDPFPYCIVLEDVHVTENVCEHQGDCQCDLRHGKIFIESPPQTSAKEEVKNEDKATSKENIARDESVILSVIKASGLPPGEIFHRKMYEEYLGKMAELAERRNMKIIKISNVPGSSNGPSENAPQPLESEFMIKVKERNEKLGIVIDQEEEETVSAECKTEQIQYLPKHLKELMEITEECGGIWSPATTPEAERKKFDFTNDIKALKEEREREKRKEEEERKEPQPAVWTPRSAGPSPTPERKFRPVNFQSPPPTRREIKITNETPELPKDLPLTPDKESKSRLTTSSSENSPLSSSLRLPTAQNPTITLLQKAREGQIPRGAQYLDEEPYIGPNEILYSVKKEHVNEDHSKKVVELGPRKIEGIGPTTKEGVPIVLRSEVKEDNQQKWYKRMYDSLHKADHDKDFVTVKYKTRRGNYPYSSYAGGYSSEPERLGYDSDVPHFKYATLDRRKIRNKENDFTSSTMPRNRYAPGVKYAVDVYKNQPGRIEDYEPGHSSIADKETKQWWDEVMDIFDGELNDSKTNYSKYSGKPYSYSFKDTGYESDSTLVFKRRENNMSDISPNEQKMAYKVIQKGGEVPLQGLRKSVPDRPKEPLGNPIPTPPRDQSSRQRSQESPHRYVESEVNIHYKSPVRREAKAAWPEDELALRQAEIMRRIYQEQKRTKYLNELHDMYSRRHADNLLPSQKSPIPLNRYDDFPLEVQPPRPRDRTPEPKLVARALYNFIGQTSRELSFKRGDIIFVRRQIDKNWYEGEHNAMIGLFPFNYVEIIPYDGIRTLPKKSYEGQARAKFNFQAQSHLELSLVKGELVLLTRRVDENWFEGRIGNRKGIFPVSYVEVLVEPGERVVSPSGSTPTKPIVAPASHSVMLNGAKDIGQQHYQPPRPTIYSSSSLPPSNRSSDISLVNQTLHIETQSDPVPYRVMYNYRPQNEDELELKEGDIVYVMEKCDDGWYVGSLHRNGQFGTFPGNYVERIQ